jgi:hypothetical protein
MRRKCQVYNHDGTKCEELAVDYGEVRFADDTVRVWMCAHHWDEHQKTKTGKWSTE